jgi:hypothetical protein
LLASKLANRERSNQSFEVDREATVCLQTVAPFIVRLVAATHCTLESPLGPHGGVLPFESTVRLRIPFSAASLGKNPHRHDHERGGP